MTKQGLEIARKNFFIALTIDLAVTVIVTYFGFSLLDTLKMLNAGTLVPDAALISSTTFKENFSYLAIATTLGVGFMLVKWVEACYAYAKEQLGATGFEREKWLWMGWVIPVIALFKPYQMLSEIFRAGQSNGVRGEQWKRNQGSLALLCWWVFYTILHLEPLAKLPHTKCCATLSALLKPIFASET